MEDLTSVADTARPAAASAIDRLRNRDRIASTYIVVTDREWAEEMLKTREELKALSTFLTNKANKDRYAELEGRLAELESRKGDAVVEFKFRFCSPVRYEKLLSANRPTDEQREQAKAEGGRAPNWAPTFRPALISEVLAEPQLSEEEVTALFGDEQGDSLLSPAEAMELFTTALMASNSVPRFEA